MDLIYITAFVILTIIIHKQFTLTQFLLTLPVFDIAKTESYGPEMDLSHGYLLII